MPDSRFDNSNNGRSSRRKEAQIPSGCAGSTSESQSLTSAATSQPGSGDSEAELRAPVEVPINGELDLHTFRPQDVKAAVTEYLEVCRARGILQVRVVHGKGIGQLRQTVHALLAKLPSVASYSLASHYYGGEGATIVNLHPAEPDDPAK